MFDKTGWGRSQPVGHATDLVAPMVCLGQHVREGTSARCGFSAP
jgi:hypothetical protein